MMVTIRKIRHRRLIIISFLILVSIGTYCCIILWDNPYSVFYKYRTHNRDKLVKIVLRHNQERYNQSLEYLKLKEQSQATHTATQRRDLVIGIITVYREYSSRPLGYLTQTVARVQKIVPRETVEIIICNTDAVPARHLEAVNLSKQFTVYSRFLPEGKHLLNMMKPFKTHTRRVADNVFLKEKDDYLFCLEKLLQYESEYVIVLEDDALPIENFIEELKTILWKLNYYFPRWGYLKLYYPPKWQGYAREWPRLLDLVYTACLGSLGLTLVYVLCRIFITIGQQKCKLHVQILQVMINKQILLVLFLGFILTLIFIEIIGRQNILELQRAFHHYSFTKSPGCCTPAILYKPSTAREMVNFLEDVKCTDKYPFDIAQEDFRKNKSIDAYLIEPSLVNHIGLVSSIKGKGLKNDLAEFFSVK